MANVKGVKHLSVAAHQHQSPFNKAAVQCGIVRMGDFLVESQLYKKKNICDTQALVLEEYTSEILTIMPVHEVWI